MEPRRANPPRLFAFSTVDFFDALPLVLGSYLTFGAVHRRVQLLLGRLRGADAEAFRVYPHRFLADALAGAGPAASGARIVHAPRSGSLGPFPPSWAKCGWFFARPERLGEARDLLLAGAPQEAARRCGDEDPRLRIHLFTWSVCLRIWAHQLDAAEAMAHALAETLDDPAPARRLLAWVEARRAESLPGAAGADAAARALAHLDLLGPSLHATPAWSALPAHLTLLRRSWTRWEWVLFDARRRIEAAAARHPESPFVHRARGHLAAARGDVVQAADHLARALYHGRGEAPFAAAILSLEGIDAVRPLLASEARARLSEDPKIDTVEDGVLQSEAPQRDPTP